MEDFTLGQDLSADPHQVAHLAQHEVTFGAAIVAAGGVIFGAYGFTLAAEGLAVGSVISIGMGGFMVVIGVVMIGFAVFVIGKVVPAITAPGSSAVEAVEPDGTRGYYLQHEVSGPRVTVVDVDVPTASPFGFYNGRLTIRGEIVDTMGKGSSEITMTSPTTDMDPNTTNNPGSITAGPNGQPGSVTANDPNSPNAPDGPGQSQSE